ncbi:MAG: anthranilate synthase component I [Actinomycetales bacterium]|nr:anthranilate synthase component I [Actinomycetales bacterium]
MNWGEVTVTLERFRELARTRRVIPVARRLLADELTPTGAYRVFGGAPGTFVLESAEHGAWSRWSFVGVRSRASLLSWDGSAHWVGDVPVGIPATGPVLDVLRAALAVLRSEPLPGYPPLTGGLVGSLGWDFVTQWERLPHSAVDDLSLPVVALCLVSDLIALDHHTGTVWLIANAINADATDERVDEAWADAVERLDDMERTLATARGVVGSVLVDRPEPPLRHRTSQQDFEASVRAGKEAIRDGEVFQVVLSLRVDVECAVEPLDVYRVLRSINPSPYMYLLCLPDPRRATGRIDVVGSSPETLVTVEGRGARTFPIAGSRPRGRSPEEDHALAAELRADPKECAEHLMLVDLARNDLAKFCDPSTVTVRDFMAVKHFSHIMHMASTVTGTMRPDATALDALVATFPAGTLSGAPKVRAMELIDQLEPTRRGVYGGTIGYLDFAGNMDMAIAIRTAVILDGLASVQAGAGIVADSVPATEYEECRNKAAAALRAVQLATRLR